MPDPLNELLRESLVIPGPSKAVIACDGNGRGCVLWAVGDYIRYEMEECGLYGLKDLGLDDAPVGISVWEGKYVWQPGSWHWDRSQDGEMLPVGKFRAPTDEEWQSIRGGQCPWQRLSPSNSTPR